MHAAEAAGYCENLQVKESIVRDQTFPSVAFSQLLQASDKVAKLEIKA